MKRLAIVALLLLSHGHAEAQHLVIQPETSGLVRPDAFRRYVMDTLVPALRAQATRMTGVDVLSFGSADLGTLNAKRFSFDWGKAPTAVPFDASGVKATTSRLRG